MPMGVLHGAIKNVGEEGEDGGKEEREFAPVWRQGTGPVAESLTVARVFIRGAVNQVDPFGITDKPVFFGCPREHHARSTATAAHSQDVFRPWGETATLAGPSTPLPASTSAAAIHIPASDSKELIVLRLDPPAAAAERPSTRSREEELEEQVRRLEAQVQSLSPPSYSGHDHE
ncbi:hypothetical protein GGX14DRAFT_603998 [Mycena pura]|uniref:Uncharacterized protein n=1 Tax=Mycena pura TaxID=153505 RepID=A0AAD6UME6_9AGAR|nr:hypothetical protein GGX14DRAFT_603998 [Mycena pura]